MRSFALARDAVEKKYTLPGMINFSVEGERGSCCASAKKAGDICALLCWMGSPDKDGKPKSPFGILPPVLQREIMRRVCPIYADSLILGPHRPSEVFFEQNRKVARCSYGPSIVLTEARIMHTGYTLVVDFEVTGGLCWSVGVLPSDVQERTALWPRSHVLSLPLQPDVTGFANDGIGCALPQLRCDTASKRGRFRAILELPGDIAPRFTIIDKDREVGMSAPICLPLLQWFLDQQKLPEEEREKNPQGLCIGFTLFKGVSLGLVIHTHPELETDLVVDAPLF